MLLFLLSILCTNGFLNVICDKDQPPPQIAYCYVLATERHHYTTDGPTMSRRLLCPLDKPAGEQTPTRTSIRVVGAESEF